MKGGTALKLFIFNLPRLSVDIDLNYIGAAERDAMIAERPKIENAIKAVCSREGLSARRVPAEHAGGKWLLRYESALGLGGNLQVDLNFMFRIPLWPVTTLNSHPVGSYEVTGSELARLKGSLIKGPVPPKQRRAGKEKKHQHQWILPCIT